MLKSDVGYLRKVTEDDLNMLLHWRNKEHIRKVMYTDHVISMDEHLAWFNRIKDRSDNRHFIFEYRGFPVGSVNFTNIDSQSDKCYFGYYLGDTEGPPGLGALMEYFALEYAFNQIGIRKLRCEVFAFNKEVIKLHKKFGFIEEGCFKEHVSKEGKYEDVIALAILKDCWVQNRYKLEKVLISRFAKI